VEAIFAEEDVPSEHASFDALNAELARVFPAITAREAALPDAEEWKERSGKLAFLER
jgi:ferredoxin